VVEEEPAPPITPPGAVSEEEAAIVAPSPEPEPTPAPPVVEEEPVVEETEADTEPAESEAAETAVIVGPGEVTVAPESGATESLPPDWESLSPKERVMAKFDLVEGPYAELQETDAETHEEAGRMLRAARAAKAAYNWPEAEGYLDGVLLLLGLEVE
jgi:hypothetical protein